MTLIRIRAIVETEVKFTDEMDPLANHPIALVRKLNEVGNIGGDDFDSWNDTIWDSAIIKAISFEAVEENTL